MKTRFAPSPTGLLHIGGVRTALFAWLAAKHEGGEFLLRIEDTDRERLVAGSEEQIIESLKWLGIELDGPVVRQSDRRKVYVEKASELVAKGLAYYDNRTDQEITELKKQAASDGKPFLFRENRPAPELQVVGPKFPIRFKTPDISIKRCEWVDAVRGKLSAGPEAVDDFIILKAERINEGSGNDTPEFPTYNFAHVIDDIDMEITHVLRGEEFIASTPKYLALYDALEVKPPVFATMPPILGKEGGKKLSKRDGAESVLDYRNQGFLPEAVMNFLASLGWNDGTDKEIYSKDELIKAFSLDRIQKSPARFDETKLNWINWQHVKLMIDSDIDGLKKYLETKNASYEDENLQAVASLAASKSRDATDFVDQLSIFFGDVNVKTAEIDLANIDPELSEEQAKQIIDQAKTKLESTKFNAVVIEKSFRALIDELNLQPRMVLMLLRDKITGKRVSPSLFETMELLGKEETLRRLSVD